MKQALGIIEVKGLASAVMIADILVKVAAVELSGIESAKGSGWMTIKVTGDVGAVQAAIEAGTSSASVSQQLIATKVIPRPADSVVDYFLPQVMIEDEVVEPIMAAEELSKEVDNKDQTDSDTEDVLKEVPKKKITKKKPSK